MTIRSNSLPTRRRSLASRLWLNSWRGRFAWLMGALALAALVCWILARMTPAWYRPLDPADDGVIRVAGQGQQRLYFDLHNAIERVPLGEQRWTITQDEINALLAVNVTPTSTGEVTDPYVVFSPGEITLCARVGRLPGGAPQGGVGSLAFSVGVVPASGGAGGESMGRVQLTGVWAGNLPVPRSLAEARLRALVPIFSKAAKEAVLMNFGTRDLDRATPIIERITHSIGDGMPFPLRYKVDQREMLIKELRVEDRRLTVVLAPLQPATVATSPR